MIDCVIVDIDGTLVDSNYHHALAWHRALRRFQVTVPLWRIHRAIGMGGDQLISHVAGAAVEAAHGDALREAWSEEFQPLLPEVNAFGDSRRFLTDIKNRGLSLVLASSGAPDQVETYLDLVGGRSLADAWTTAEDAEKTKPAPDLVQIALDKIGGGEAIMIGDSPWDAIAAGKLHIPTYGVRTGGFADSELREAGAAAVYSSLDDLCKDVDAILG
jgi:phosphoglycolate phosphatase-like HAD superfamily hydrolase